MSNYIEFIYAKAKNFLSIGTEPIHITFKQGLNVIQGINNDKDGRSNGSGKTTLMEMIYFATFGKTLKKLNMGDIVNWSSKKGTEVELSFKKGKDTYKIIRQIKPSGLFFYKNGEDKTRDTSTNTQNDILDVFGATEDVVRNSVIMSIGKTTPFMAQSKTERRKFIDGLFDMSIFSTMLRSARSDCNELEKQLAVAESMNQEKIRSRDVYTEKESKFEENKKNNIDRIKESIKTTVSNIENLKSQIVKVEGESDDYYDTIFKDLDSKREKLDEIKSNLSTKINHNEGIIAGLVRQIKNTTNDEKCPTCLRVITEDDRCFIDNEIQSMKDEIRRIKDSNDKLNERYKTITEGIGKIVSKRKQIEAKRNSDREVINRNNRVERSIEECNRTIKLYVEQIETLKLEENTFSGMIEVVNSEIESNKKLLDTLNVDIEVLNKIKFILSENGVKSFIVNKMLDIFNSKINYYLSRLNANCRVSFNEFFEETIINDKRQPCSYYNFSSGEARNIDISIMLAFMDIQKLQGGFETNLSCFDELIDTNLDSDGIRYVIDILNDIVEKENKSIYLITHREDGERYATGERLLIEKNEGISTLKTKD